MPTKQKVDISAGLTAAMNVLGWSAKDVADRCQGEVSEKTVRAAARGQPVSLGTAHIVASAFGWQLQILTDFGEAAQAVGTGDEHDACVFDILKLSLLMTHHPEAFNTPDSEASEADKLRAEIWKTLQAFKDSAEKLTETAAGRLKEVADRLAEQATQKVGGAEQFGAELQAAAKDLAAIAGKFAEEAAIGLQTASGTLVEKIRQWRGSQKNGPGPDKKP